MLNVNTIVLKGHGHHEEGEASGAVSPGMAVDLAADGRYGQVAATQAEALKSRGLKIAKEDALQGKTISDAYAAGDRLFLYQPQRGDHIHALVASGQTVVVGARGVVQGGGSGLFVVGVGTETGYQLEFLEDSGGALAANTHLKARVL